MKNPAADKGRTGPAIKAQRSPAFSVPLPYLVAGMGAFVLFASAVPFLAGDLVRTNDDPHVFALTHLAALGWITMVVQGALYQLLPVALQADLRSTRLPRWNFWVYAAGVAGFVPSFYFGWALGVALFGSLTAGGLAQFMTLMLRSFPSVRSRHPMAAYVLTGQISPAAKPFGERFGEDGARGPCQAEALPPSYRARCTLWNSERPRRGRPP